MHDEYTHITEDVTTYIPNGSPTVTYSTRFAEDSDILHAIFGAISFLCGIIFLGFLSVIVAISNKEKP